LKSALQIIESDKLYKEKYAEIRKLTDPLSLEERAASGDLIAFFKFCASSIETYYILMIQNTAHLSALRAAIEIYLAMAKAGRVPKVLPDGLPKDPYSGKGFRV